MKIYLDNAATTPLDPAVFEVMTPYMLHDFGNPSSIHGHGRKARSAIEKARKTIASLINASPSEIFFTSGGTEADNTAIKGSVHSLGVTEIITSQIEHHAVLHTVERLQSKGNCNLHFVRFDSQGKIDLEHLEELLSSLPITKTLVSLMHGNNEIGNILSLDQVSDLCTKYGAFFHSDTVQTIGHYTIDAQKTPLSFLAASAHKFHGPKGIGFLYVNSNNHVSPLMDGGSQERNMRGGTENVAAIVGMAYALEQAYINLEQDKAYIIDLKNHLIQSLQEKLPGTSFNGLCTDFNDSLFTVVSALLPPSDNADMILMKLDIEGISVSGGSACTSGTNIGSHVLDALHTNPDRGAIRFSLSKLNTKEEVDIAINTLASIF